MNKELSILITGGTGSFGKFFIREVLNLYPNLKRLVIYSRDELKQWEISQEFPSDKYKQIRFFLGDIRDQSRLKRALEGIDVVVHAAALKQVPAAEYNPIEFIYTNVIGAQNIIQACFDTKVKKVIALSTDKAAAPTNLYGATKLCADKLFIAANNMVGKRDLIFSVVRYGNVIGSRGSVIPLFMKEALQGKVLSLTDPEMTRFTITLKEGFDMVIWAISNALGSEIFVPKIPSYKLKDVAEAIGPGCEKVIVGIRNGEKIHESLITPSDSPNTLDLGKYYAILPSQDKIQNLYDKNNIDYEKVNHNFEYNSGTNKDFVNIKQIRELIINNVDKDFVPK